MDEVDGRIIAALEENARMPLAELARKLKITARMLADRIRRLEAGGVIEGYRAIINPAKVGLATRAWVSVKAPRDRVTAIIALARVTPEVKELHYTSGPYAFVMRVVARSDEDLDRVLASFGEHAVLECSRIASTPVERRTTLI
jgi:Lrp/AsnC family transcriptional regulator, leucine-responsive regulatory protein